MAALNIESASFARLRDNYETSGQTFLRLYGDKITGAGNARFSATGGQQTCAIRLSMALYLAGLRPPRVVNSWLYTVTNESGDVIDRVYLPSLAADFASGMIIADGQEITERPTDQGVIYFGGGLRSASGHVTLWDGTRALDNGEYWNQPTKVFWPMAR